MRKFFVYHCLFALCMLSGCAAQQHTSPDLPVADASPAADALAYFVGTSPDGAVTTLSDAGEQLTVTVGKGYISALNQPCRKAELRSTRGLQSMIVCKENNAWYRAPAIFSVEANKLP